MTQLRGMDMSVYQWERYPAGHKYQYQPVMERPVDFTKCKDINFAWVRALTIDGYPDYAFEENWAGLKAVGIPRGAYGFANQTDPVGYAKRMFNVVQATGDIGELPPALDFECRYIASTKTYIGKMDWNAAWVWLQAAKTFWKMNPIIYSSYSMWFNPPPPWTPLFNAWVASYTAVNGQPKWMPKGFPTWQFWQQGTPAIGKAMGMRSEELDIDVFNGDVVSFNKTFNINTVITPTLEEKVDQLEFRTSELERLVSNHINKI
jgi:lysozyme